jgi:hypothetical protein
LKFLFNGDRIFDFNEKTIVKRPLHLKYNDIFCCNIQATQELDRKVLELETKVTNQETLIQSLISRIEALENN